ncbi:hypothetical protein D3C86_1749360 [compost metagenome]
MAPLVGKNDIFRRTNAEDYLYVSLRAVLRQPATHRHHRRHAATCRQHQEFVVGFVVANEIPLRVGEPQIIPALHLVGQPLRARTVIDPPHGERDVFTHAWR